MSESAHPSRRDLAAFVGGSLPETETGLIGQHLESCVQCEQLLADLPADGFLLQLRRLVGSASPAALTRSEDDCTPRPPRFLDTTSWPPLHSGSRPDWPCIAGYEIVAELGRGGMGVVYKAWQTRLERYVAVKILNRGSDIEDLLRFRTEAQAVAQVQHPAIVQIYDVGEQAGQPYLCLEFVDGGNLAQRLAAGPMQPREAAEMSCTLAEALHVVHQLGIIHRDLKPANILLGAGGQPKINDFGLAKRLDVELGHTLSGVILGTPSYMAPEQARGLSKQTTAAADVYSLGATLYEMLTGRPPFKAASQLDTLQQVLTSDPVSPRRLQATVPRDLETICLKCLDKEPARRYASAADLAADLHRFLDGVPIQARPSSRLECFLKWMRRRPATATLLGTILVAVAILSGMVVIVKNRQGEEVGRLRIPDGGSAEFRNDPSSPPPPEKAKTRKAAASVARVIDDSDSAYAETGDGWINGSIDLEHAYRHSYRVNNAGAQTARWTFTELRASEYEVFATWVAHENRAAKAAYSLYDGERLVRHATLNQQKPPGDFTSPDGQHWQRMATVRVGSGTLVVELDTRRSAGGAAVADAVRVVRAQGPNGVRPAKVSHQNSQKQELDP